MHVDEGKFKEGDSEPPDPYGRAVRCTTCDEFPVATHSDRLAKLHCAMRVLECPNELFEFGPPDDKSCTEQINWSDEIKDDGNPTKAFRALKTLVYATYYLQNVRLQFAADLTPQEIASADKEIQEYKDKLPKIIQIFQLATGNFYAQQFAELLSVLTLLK
jgi:hypothetical protein